MKCFTVWGLVLALSLGPLSTHAQSSAFPNKPVRIIVPFPAGGSADSLVRVVSQHLNKRWGQPVLIENKPGAGTNIGSEFVAKAPGDGYTLLLSNSSQVANATMYGKAMPYDLLRDLAPVTMIGMTPVLLVVHPSLPVKTARDLIALAKAKPGQLTFASAGIGSPTHIAPELFRWMAKIDMLHVPYKSEPPAVVDLISGQVQVMVSSYSTIAGHLKGGRLRALATALPQRSSLLPDVPTVAEAGLKGYESSQWYGLFAPLGTPADILNLLNAQLAKIMQSADIKARLGEEGVVPVGGTREQLAAHVKSEIAKWANVIKLSGARVD